MMGHPVINTHSHHQAKNRTQTRASNKHRLLCGWGGCLVTKEADSSAGWVQGGGCVMGAGAGCVDHRSEKSHLSQVKIVSKIQNFSMKQKQKYIYQEKVEEKKKS